MRTRDKHVRVCFPGSLFVILSGAKDLAVGARPRWRDPSTPVLRTSAQDDKYRRTSPRLLSFVASIAVIGCFAFSQVSAQPARVSGFVTDATSGSPLAGATVALFNLEDEEAAIVPAYGTVTTADGLFLLNRIDPGSYALRLSFVGFQPHVDSLLLQPGQTYALRVALRPGVTQGDELLVESERIGGATNITAGYQEILPEDLKRVPSPDLSADLTSYLTTLPGVVSTGDRGGQLFVRGGEPTQNLTTLDQIYLFQPFHVLGFYSAFPADLIDRVRFYAGGYGARYAGRLSSVMDVAARPGNNQRFAGMASVSPFTGSLRLEGPIIPGKASVIGMARQSLLHRTDEALYGQRLPFRFGDAFAKIQATPTPRGTFSATALHTSDRGLLTSEINDAEAQEVTWTNTGIGGRWLLLPRFLPVVTDVTLSHARHEMRQSTSSDTSRTTRISNTRITLDATFFNEGTATWSAGWEAVLGRSENDLNGLFQNLEAAEYSILAFGLYAEPELRWRGLRLQPGVRVNWYNVRFDPYVEPRLRLSWERGLHHFSGAVGVYHQQVIGLSDRRDAASVFTAWINTPRQDDRRRDELSDEVLRGRLGQAWHAIVGYRSSPSPWLSYAVESFYKRTTNLFVGAWTALPRLTTRLQPAIGRSFGFEARLELRRRPVYAYATYGFSNTEYAGVGRAIPIWYGTEKLRYRPGHDRRHQVNVLASSTWRGFSFSARWAFGSGLPYTRPLAFDGFALVDDVRRAEDLEHSRRVIYERPF